MKRWYVAQDRARIGPFNAEHIAENFDLDVLVWAKGMKEWTKASDVPEIVEAVASMPPPVPVQDTGFLKEVWEGLTTQYASSSPRKQERTRLFASSKRHKKRLLVGYALFVSAALLMIS